MFKIFSKSKKILFTFYAFVLNLVFAKTVLAADESCMPDFFKRFEFTVRGGKTENAAQGLTQICTAAGAIKFAIDGTLILAGSIAVLFIMMGGFWYLTSGGNEETAEKGKKTLVNSIIGLVVIIMAYAIVRIITSLVTSG
jgi:hypothetical protein